MCSSEGFEYELRNWRSLFADREGRNMIGSYRTEEETRKPFENGGLTDFHSASRGLSDVALLACAQSNASCQLTAKRATHHNIRNYLKTGQQNASNLFRSDLQLSYFKVIARKLIRYHLHQKGFVKKLEVHSVSKFIASKLAFFRVLHKLSHFVF